MQFHLNIDSGSVSSTNIPLLQMQALIIIIVIPVNTIILRGSGKDTDGFVTTFLWSKINGPATFVIANPNQAITAIHNLVQGIYQYELTVTDNNGATGKDTVTIQLINASSNRSLALQQELDAADPINDSMNYNAGIITKITSNYHQQRFIYYSNNRISTIDYWYDNHNGDFYKTLTHTFVYDVHGNVIQIYETQLPIN